ncbi:hypothetical protein HY489_04310 [Candidatus Woesearchaeota archaeon]|nr:hypothetical protein [Candidatus Woesearchaeota archaeon]
MKRGSVELWILLAVLVVAIVGIVFVLKTPVAQVVPQTERPVPRVPAASGGFVIPGAREYGGAVRGIAAPGTRAFPAGRAFEIGEQHCYTCSCLTTGITSDDRVAAERVCADNCGGTLINDVLGPCQ